MRKIFSWFVVCTFVGLLALVFIPEPVDAMTGSGTAEDPYVIWNATDLQNMQNSLSAYYELGCDIDASETSGWNGGAGFDPVGSLGTPFTGHFDGQGYSITDLYIDRSSESFVGLFAAMDGADMGNVIFVTPDITALKSVGVVGGNLQNTITQYVMIVGGSVTATETGQADAGGICALSGGSGYIYRCFSSATVTASGSSVGGFSGQTATIYESYCLGAVSGTSHVGGLVGQQHSGIIQNSFARGSVSGTLNVGGLIGRMTDWYATSRVDNCYSTGVSSISGLIGTRIGSTYVTDSFWDTETSGCPTSAGGTGKTTIEMKTQSTFTGAGWDFDTVWEKGGTVNDGYPYLLWWYNPPDIISDVNQVVWFQPNAIIEGTELPNRAQSGTLIDGEIHWGANPAGITISHGELIPEEEYNFEPIVPGSQDIIKPEPEAMTTDVDTARLVDNPLYPLVHALGSMPGLNDRLVWLMLAWLVVIASMLFVHIGFDTKKGTQKPQHFVLTTITGLGLSILFYTMGIFPLWVVILMVFGLIGSIIWERQPVL